MVNTNMLVSRMKEIGVTQADIADKLKLARPTVSQKLRNVRPMYLDEAECLSELLKIEPCDFGSYFFTQEVAQRN